MKKLTFLLLVFCAFQLPAQYPGYMGKKFTFGYSFAVRPNFLSIIYGSDIKYAGPAQTHSLSINIVHSVRREICLAARYMTMRFNNSYYGALNTTGIPYYERYHQLEYSLGFKKFGRSKFAPLGIYSKWEVFYASGWLNYAPFTMDSYDPASGSDIPKSFSGGSVKFRGGGGTYSFGRQRVLNHKVLFDIGVKGSLMVLIPETLTSYEERLGQTVRYGMGGLPLVGFYAGFGFLAF